MSKLFRILGWAGAKYDGSGGFSSSKKTSCWPPAFGEPFRATGDKPRGIAAKVQRAVSNGRRGRGFNDLLMAEPIRYVAGSAAVCKSGAAETVIKEYACTLFHIFDKFLIGG